MTAENDSMEISPPILPSLRQIHRLFTDSWFAHSLHRLFIFPTGSHRLNLNMSDLFPSSLSVHKLTIDNPVFVQFHSSFFLVNDNRTKEMLLQGTNQNGLYIREDPPHIAWSSSLLSASAINGQYRASHDASSPAIPL